MLLLLAACTPSDSKNGHDSEEVEELGPIDVTGFGEDAYIDERAGDSEAEPSVVALPDNKTIIASWMNLDGYSLYIKYSRSEDGGKTWSEAEMIDEDRWGYQNDPVLVQGGGYVYFTWLAVEGSRYDTANVYCVDSTDGGKTWSDKVQLTESGAFNDRQWMAVDDTGRAVVTWDYFPNNSYTEQAYSESDGGCAGFSEPEIIATGSFLNGGPAIDTDGQVWTSRTEYDYRSGETRTIVATQDEDGDWQDDTILATESAYAAATAVAEDPEEEHEETIEAIERAAEGEYTRTPVHVPISSGMEYALSMAGGTGDRHVLLASGNFDGFYSPVLQPLPDGRLAIVQAGFEDGSNDTPDVYFFLYDHGDVQQDILNQDAAGIEQMEPWMVVDPQGGIHVSWFDAREGAWRLYGASSIDAGETFTEYTIGDATFRHGFDDKDGYRWVGHFQGLTANEEKVIAVWGDSSEDDVSLLRVDTSVAE